MSPKLKEYHDALGGSEGYPAWVAALAFTAFIFALACIGGIFAELVGLFIDQAEGLVRWLKG